jgi:hypothetical protein
MIFLDLSGGSLLTAMQKIEAYARRKGLKFPKIDYTHLETKAISVFMEDDPSIPVVIYFPRISESGLWQKHKDNAVYKKYSKLEQFDFTACVEESNGFCKTARFQYSPEESSQLIDQMEFNILVHREKIVEVINKFIDLP